MAERLVKEITCDRNLQPQVRKKPQHCGRIIDNSQEPIVLYRGGEFYRLDLCDEHREETERLLDSLIKDASPSGPPVTANSRKRYSFTTESGRVVDFDAKEARDWLRENRERNVPETGRLPQALVQEYFQHLAEELQTNALQDA